MLPQVRLEAAGHSIDAGFALALPVTRGFDLARPVESLTGCMRYADNAFLLDVTGANPLGWGYDALAGTERLKGAAFAVRCLGEQPDQDFTRSVLVPSYLEAIAADQPVVHRVAAIANSTFLAYRRMTIPLHAAPRAPRASHLLALTQLDFAIPLGGLREEGLSQLRFRERQCLSLAASGLVGKQIAAEIGVSEKTVELHLARARHKLGARTTAHSVAISLAMAMLKR
jgi:DNA-binding CsgD family transcriptional regulator